VVFSVSLLRQTIMSAASVPR